MGFLFLPHFLPHRYPLLFLWDVFSRSGRLILASGPWIFYCSGADALLFGVTDLAQSGVCLVKRYSARGEYARTCVVRVDLHYRKEAQARLRVERVFDDLRRLIKGRERDPIFDHQTGYICSVEQGEDRGYHIHAAFFFNGSEVGADIYRAHQIGELWERITLGQGCYHNCNREKAKHRDRLGDWDDPAA